jgi:rhodanese-related sulfurtransferase
MCRAQKLSLLGQSNQGHLGSGIPLGAYGSGPRKYADFQVLDEHSTTVMAKTLNQMVADALEAVPTVPPTETYQRLQHDPYTLVVDVRDPADIPATGIIPGAINVPLGSLTYKADDEVPEEWRDPQLQDRSRPIITTCMLGPMGALAGKLLKDMGFTDVSILDGGVEAWKDAGLPTEQFGET